jgi:RNA polymerase sigma-70 factor (ECF subfamily)
VPRRGDDTEELLARAEAGDTLAVGELLDRHRARLRRMVAVRMDRRLSPRLDPSDVVQDALAEASRRLSDYLLKRPLPFYPWLRQIAWERLVHLHDRHLRAQKRAVGREEQVEMALSEQSAMQLADRLLAPGTSPSRRLLRAELRARVRTALDRLPPHDREILVMWHLEELSVGEIAALLGLTQSGVKSRHRRALERLLGVLDDKDKLVEP